VRYWQQQIFVVITSVLLLTGCAGSGSVSGGGGWPIETYPNACETTMIPWEPSCLGIAGYDGFKYRDEFQACRLSMQAYQYALDEHYSCTKRKLTAIFDELLTVVPKTYNCYVEFFSDKSEGDPTSVCTLVEVPKFHHSYEADGLEYDLGVPWCVRKDRASSSAPKREYRLEDCREQVRVFAGENVLGQSLYAKSAQEQFDTYMRNLKRVLEDKADEAVEKFNCMAEGRQFCI
jgi:hypothetical protein